jgi:hypothetical protein
MKSVSVITVNFNQSAVTEALLNSIFHTNTYTPLEIIVVDNGSKVNPIPEWQTKYPSVKFVRSETNRGFAGGNNLGLSEATGDYLFFVNNDTEFTTNLVATLAKTLDMHPMVGMVSPKIRYYTQPDVLQYAGYTKMNYLTARNKCIGQYEKDDGQYDLLTGKTGYVHGAAMMVRGEAVTKVGGMPEMYFLYFEEYDWCEQIRRAGYEIWVDTRALIYHKESISVGSKSGLKEYFMNRNRILFIRRNCNVFTVSVFWMYFICIVSPRNILGYKKNGQKGFTSILLKAIRWNLIHTTSSVILGYPINNIA